MTKQFQMFALALVLLTVAAINPQGVFAVDDGCPGDYSLTYTITTFGSTQKVATNEAHDILADDVADLNSLMPEGCEIVAVHTSGSWDGIAYDLSVRIFVACNCGN